MKFYKYNKKYQTQVIDLLNISFPGKNITEESFIWKYFDEFFNKRAVSMVAVKEDKVVSFVCFVPISIQKGKKCVKDFYSCAVQATHPDFRRQGLVSKLTKSIEKKLGESVSYLGFSNNAGVMIDRYSKTIQYEILGQLYTQYIFSFPYKTELNIEKVDKPSEIENKSDHYQILKNKEYLTWRYFENPKIDYSYYKVVKRKTLVGYIIARKSTFRFEIIDLILDEVDEQAFLEVLKLVSSFAFKQKKFLVTFSYFNNGFWEKTIPGFSFQKKQQSYFTIKSSNAEVLNIKDWLLQLGDIQ